MNDLAISLLGPFSVRRDDLSLEAFRSKSAAALLILLVVEGRPLRREWLIELLWPEMAVGAGRKNLRQALYELRQTLPENDDQETASPHPFILADRQTIQLNDRVGYHVDTVDFTALLEQGELEDLRQAVDLYQGDFLADFYLPNSSAFEDWSAAKRALFRRLALDAMDQLAQHDLQRGHYDRAAILARRQLALDSLRESAVQQLLVALALNGRRNEALAQYEESRAELSRELGVEPEPATQTVYERIVSGEVLPSGAEVLALLHPIDATPPTPAATQAASEARSNNLPADPTPFVGRRREAGDITSRLLDPACRLLTVLGPGGCGKSRLAIQVARRLLQEQPEQVPDGVWYATLTEPADADQVISTLVNDLSFTALDPASDLRAQLLSYLRGRQMILLLDNMEYMQDPEAGRFLSELLDQSPGVTLLACSRTRLNLRAEQLFPVAGLDVPAADLPLEDVAGYSAVQLFVNSARRVRPEFSLTAGTIPPTLSICRQLQGIPLAIELAASWIEAMSPAEVATEVERCFDFLESDWLDIPERQRSLRAVFETSWRLLNGQERAAFLRLSVFRGGFDYPAARQIADASQRTLLGLLNKSWLQRDESGRYLAHEMLRQYAYQLLSDDELAWQSAHDRHSVYFAELATAQGALLKGPQQVAATVHFDVELENITAAWEWFAEKERYKVLIDQLLPGLFLYFAARSRGQRLVSLVTRTRRKMESSPAPVEPAWQVILLTVQSAFFNEFLISRYLIANAYPPSGQEQIEAAYELAHQHELQDYLGIWSLHLATLYGWAFDRAEVLDWLRRLVKAHRADADAWLLALTLESLGALLLPTGLGRPGGQEGREEAHRCLSEAVSLFENLGDRREKGYALTLWGLLRRQGDFADAKRMLLAAQRDMEVAGDLAMDSLILGFLSDICMARGEVSEGFAYSHRVRRQAARLGLHHFEAGALSWESQWALRLDTVEHAREARQESLAVAKRSGDDLNHVWGTWELGEIERMSGNYALARDIFAEAQQLFTNYADPYAPPFLERGLGDLAYDLGRYEESLRHFEKSLYLAEQVSHQWAVSYALFGLARARLALAQADQKDQINQAQDHFLHGLRVAYYHGYAEQYSLGVAGLAACYAAGGQVGEALRLVHIVLANPTTWQETRRRAEALQTAILAERPELAGKQDPELPTMHLVIKDLLEPS